MKVKLPLSEEVVSKLSAGMKVSLSGKIFVARDAAHKKIIQLLSENKPIPVDIKNATIYYMGPSPAKPGEVIGSCGPTTSGRMDQYTIPLLKLGLKGMIGKGLRSPEVREGLKKYKAVYFAAIGGAGALISKRVKSSKVLAFEELGAEALRELEVEDFDVIVVNDSSGRDLYEEGKKKYSLL